MRPFAAGNQTESGALQVSNQLANLARHWDRLSGTRLAFQWHFGSPDRKAAALKAELKEEKSMVAERLGV